MDTNPPPTTTPPSRPANKWLRMGRKILVGAVIVFCMNLFLKITGWNTWEKFSKQADNFSESMMTGAMRLSPMGLCNSITSTDTRPEGYFDYQQKWEKQTLKDKLLSWVGNYWFTESGKSFWFGRVLLLFSILGALLMASEDYGKARNKMNGLVAYPFNVIIKFFGFLLGISLLCIALYFVIKIFLAIGAGIVFITSGIHAIGGFILLLFEEAKNEAADASKKTVAAYIFPFLFRKKK